MSSKWCTLPAAGALRSNDAVPADAAAPRDEPSLPLLPPPVTRFVLGQWALVWMSEEAKRVEHPEENIQAGIAAAMRRRPVNCTCTGVGTHTQGKGGSPRREGELSKRVWQCPGGGHVHII
eukprot:6465031-Amphidinium_carterae.1